ncbi:MAG: 50S ribosomal protein L33 [Deltaproteobacteria bacterium]|nr:50S ribosomal protein L33 [Deltaproteobacteria bacterium]
MAKNANRVFVKMKSPESGFMYYTSKNRVTTPGRLELRKYDPIVRKHVLFKETK